jgi:hypothetical protein
MFLSIHACSLSSFAKVPNFSLFIFGRGSLKALNGLIWSPNNNIIIKAFVPKKKNCLNSQLWFFFFFFGKKIISHLNLKAHHISSQHA